jgi:hypothetical protein
MPISDVANTTPAERWPLRPGSWRNRVGAVLGFSNLDLFIVLFIAACGLVCLLWVVLVVVPGRGPVAKGGALDRLANRLAGVGPLDFLRKRLAKGLQVGASRQELRRGEQVDALVTILSARGLGQVEVGLVCTELYDHKDTSTDYEGKTQSSRATSAAIAHEAWLPVENTPGVQSVGFTVPPEAPFSYEGSCLSFKWEVVARGRRRRRLDALARQEVSVLP